MEKQILPSKIFILVNNRLHLLDALEWAFLVFLPALETAVVLLSVLGGRLEFDQRQLIIVVSRSA